MCADVAGANRRGRGRGRGRGGARGGGRGRGRGRGGARGGRGGRGGARGGAAGAAAVAEIVHSGSGIAGDDSKQLSTDAISERNYDSAYMRALFLRDAKLQEHIDALRANASLYTGQLRVMIDRKVALHFSAATKARILAACLCVESKQTPQNHSKIDYKALRAAATLPNAPGGANANKPKPAPAAAAVAVAGDAKKDDTKTPDDVKKADAPATAAPAAVASASTSSGGSAGADAVKSADDFVVINKPSARAMRKERFHKLKADKPATKADAVTASVKDSKGDDAKADVKTAASASSGGSGGSSAVSAVMPMSGGNKLRPLRPKESMVDLLLSRDDLIGLGEVVAAVRLLDNGRKLKVAKLKLSQLEAVAAKAKAAQAAAELAAEAEAKDKKGDAAATDASASTSAQESGSTASASASADEKKGKGKGKGKGDDKKAKSKAIATVKANTIAKLKTEVNNLGQEPVNGFTMTGARAKRVRQWIATLPAETLEFYALNYPFTNWKELADIVHARKEDFALDYFLSIAFGGTAPDKSLYAAAQGVTSKTLESVLETYPRLAGCYSFLRKRLASRKDEKQAADDRIKAIMAMGFSNGKARLALQHPANRNDVQTCVDWLLEQGARLDGKEPAAADDTDADMSNAARQFLARNAPLETILWWYEEFADVPGVEKIVFDRLKKGEKLAAGGSARSNYGKLMERLLYFRENHISFAPLLLPYAEERLTAIRETHGVGTAPAAVAPAKDAKDAKDVKAAASSADAKSATPALSTDNVKREAGSAGAAAAAPPGGAAVATASAAADAANNAKAAAAVAADVAAAGPDISVAVLGDASGSMEVAIKCASALGSLLSAALHADLVFFNTEAIQPPVLPRTAAEAVKVVEHMRAEGGTAMAAALWPYYQKRIKKDLFVLVSDEGENAQYQNYYFAELFAQYKRDVNPGAKVVLVSFLAVGDVGTIKQRLNAVGLDATQFRLDASRPDTSKFDSLLGLVSLETGYFAEMRAVVEEVLCDKFGLPTPLIPVVMQY